VTDRTPRPCLHARARHEHGTRLAYTLDGCRCYPCCAARSVYQRQLAYGRGTFVDAGPAREHVRALLAAGLGTRQVAALSGVSRSGLRSLLDGRTREDGRVEPPKRRVSRSVADRLLAVPLPGVDAFPDATPIDGTGTRRRLQALAVLGWSNVKLARELGMTPSNYGTFTRRDEVLARHAREVRDLYDRLSTTPPAATSGYDRAGIERVKASAKRSGWVGPLAWDDETIDDPAARPDVGRWRDGSEHVVDEVAVHRAMRGDRAVRLRIGERAEVVRRLVELGLNDQQIERRTGISSRTALRVRHADDVGA